MSKKKKYYDEDGNDVNIKEKKPFYKKWWFIAIVALVILSPFIPDEDEEAAEPTEPDTEEVADIEEEAVVEAEEDVEEEDIEETEALVEETEEALEELDESENTEEVSIDFLLTFLRSQPLGEMGSFDFDEELNAITYVPEDEDVRNAFVFVGAGMLEEEYEDFKATFSSLSTSISEFKDVGFIIVNPENTDNMLLWFDAGLLIYDFANE